MSYTMDGLLHCDKCHEPLERIVDIGDGERKMSRLCKCQRESDEAMTRKMRKQSAYLAAMVHFPTAISVDIRSEHCDHRVKRYLSKWPEMREKNIGLLLWGDVGTGKTASAAYVREQLQRQYVPCLMTTLSKVINTSFGAVIPKLCHAEMLILDDLGVERQGEYMTERVFEVINDRINAGKPMILTTNMSLGEMQSPRDTQYGRLYDRILSACVPIKFQGESFRKEQSRQRLAEVKALLEK